MPVKVAVKCVIAHPTQPGKQSEACNSLNQNVSGNGRWHSSHMSLRAREPPDATRVEVNKSWSKVSVAGEMVDASRTLRVGVVGAGVTGRNYAI